MPAAGLVEFINSESNKFASIAQAHNADAGLVNRALEIVRAFGVEKNLVLYGGQAIDYALRLRGARIYPDDVAPDYDFYSPRGPADAYELADRLASAGFKRVGAIHAIHVQTMRVSTNSVFVADISFVPPEIFAGLPTVSYAGLRVLHPDHQRSDIHLAFCFPFANPPREDIFNRFAKDLLRLRLISELYPIELGSTLNGGDDGARNDPATVVFQPSRAAFAGFAAYAMIFRAFDDLAALAAGVPAAAESLAESVRIVQALPRPRFGIVRKGARLAETVFEPPAGTPKRVSLVTPWPAEVVAALAGDGRPVEWRAPYMDARPLTALVGDAEVLSTHNRLLAVFWIKVGDLLACAASPQHTLLYFLHGAQTAKDTAVRNTFVRFYVATLEIIEAGGKLIASLRADSADSADSADNLTTDYAKVLSASPFGLPVSVLGDRSLDPAYLARISSAAQRVGDARPYNAYDIPGHGFLPAAYFPGGRQALGEHPTFLPEEHPVFMRDGRVLSTEPNF